MTHNSCKQVRRFVVSHSTLNIATGTMTQGEKEWITRECGVPLFSDNERQTGICRSCASGWTHPENYPIPKDKSK